MLGACDRCIPQGGAQGRWVDKRQGGRGACQREAQGRKNPHRLRGRRGLFLIRARVSPIRQFHVFTGIWSAELGERVSFIAV